MSAVQILQERELFDFTPARAAIAGTVEECRAIGRNEAHIIGMEEQVLLCAAEFCALEQFARGADLDNTITVTESAGIQALIKSDCIIYEDPCLFAVGGSSPRFTSVLLFDGDQHKVRLALNELKVSDLPDEMSDVVRIVETRHTESRLGIGDVVARSGLLRIQGALWQGRLTLLFAGPRPLEGIDEAGRAVASYLREMPWGQPVTVGTH